MRYPNNNPTFLGKLDISQDSMNKVWLSIGNVQGLIVAVGPVNALGTAEVWLRTGEGECVMHLYEHVPGKQK